MRRLLSVGLLGLLPAVVLAAGVEPVRMTFEGDSSERKWALKELGADLPADWSGYGYLVMELRASSPQRFELRLYTADGIRKVGFHPFAGAWVRTAVPLRVFQGRDRTGNDLASVSNRSQPVSFLNQMGPFGPLNAVEAIGVFMNRPIGAPTVEIRAVQLAKDAPAEALLEPKPLVDEFGQWILADWPDKARTLDGLKEAWAEEDNSLRGGGSGYCQYGGFKSTRAKATGFFRVEQIDGRWWLVDPDGHLFFSVGADCMGPGIATRTQNRDGVFAALPPANLAGRGGGRAGAASGASFYTWNLQRRFGDDWQAKWVDLSIRRMEAWGLNTIANWSDARLWNAHRKPYVVNLRGWGTGRGYLGLPDVYAADFAQQVDQAATQQCASRKDDPFLLGYFVANEPAWPGRELDVVEMILAAGDVAMARELKAYLAQSDTPVRRRTFVYTAFEKYLTLINAAIRKHDPNHLNLGLRFGSHASDEILQLCRTFDVYSMNNYDYAVNRAEVERANRITGRPVIIGEFHFGTPGRGMSAGLRQTGNQEERRVAYRYYVENAAAIPCLIGAHWFQWIDEPCTGRFDGENYNIGMVDVTDRPYTELVEAMRATHKRLQDVHAGKELPVIQRAKVQ